MKTILLLNDESGSGKLRLQNTAVTKVTAPAREGSPGCNCDRWGHPCTDCVERNVKGNAELPISTRTKQTESSTPPSSRREAKYENLRVPGLPVMEIDSETSHILSSNISV
jgi:hypothetical protein